ncbi:MAG: DUF6159 family protein [Candidatus Aenigmatarchaeota archaeon]
MVFESFLRGLKLVKIGFQVLGKDKEILLLPLAAVGIVAAMFILTFALLFIALLINPIIFIVIFIIELVIASFVTTFFQAAVVECARIRLTGGDPKARDGIKLASTRKKAIFTWAIVNLLVGSVIQSLERRLGRLFGSLMSFTWRTATIFVLPVILYEKLGAWGSVKRSAQLIKKGWGEAISSGLGIGILFFILALPGLGLLYFAMVSGSLIMGAPLIIIAIIYWFVLSIVNNAIKGIIVAALYVTVSGKRSADKRIHEIEKILSK